MRLPLGRKDYCGAMVARTFKKLVLFFRMLHHLVFAGECLLAVAFRTLISPLSVVNSCHVSIEVAWLSERLLVRTTWACANQGSDMDVSDVGLQRRGRMEGCLRDAVSPETFLGPRPLDVDISINIWCGFWGGGS